MSLPEPVVPLPLVVEPVVLPVLPVVPVLLPEDWAKANGAAPSIPIRTIFFINPFITRSSKADRFVGVHPRLERRVGRDARRHH